MQILFIDESGTPPNPDKIKAPEIFVLGGVIIPDGIWHDLNTKFSIIKNKYKVSGELKWRHFYVSNNESKMKTHSLSHLSWEKRNKLRSDLIELISKEESLVLLACVVDTNVAFQKSYMKTKSDLYQNAYKCMTERFQYYLQDISKERGEKNNGIIICDHRNSRDDQSLQNLHQKLVVANDQYYSTYKNLIEGVFMAPSHHSLGIQLADLVAGSVTRFYYYNDQRFFPLIKKKFRSQNKKIEGFGIVYVPKNDFGYRKDEID